MFCSIILPQELFTVMANDSPVEREGRLSWILFKRFRPTEYVTETSTDLFLKREVKNLPEDFMYLYMDKHGQSFT